MHSSEDLLTVLTSFATSFYDALILYFSKSEEPPLRGVKTQHMNSSQMKLSTKDVLDH